MRMLANATVNGVHPGPRDVAARAVSCRMHWRWLFNGFADPHLSLTPQQRKMALEAATRPLRLRLVVVTILFLIPPALGAVWAINSVDATVAAYINVSKDAVHWAMLGIFLVLFWVWSAFVYGHAYTRPYRRALRQLGIRICVNCGYSLESLDPQSRCPECGWREPADAAPGAQESPETD